MLNAEGARTVMEISVLSTREPVRYGYRLPHGKINKILAAFDY